MQTKVWINTIPTTLTNEMDRFWHKIREEKPHIQTIKTLKIPRIAKNPYVSEGLMKKLINNEVRSEALL